MAFEVAVASAINADVNRYTYRAEWCNVHEEYIAGCVEMPYMVRRAKTAPEAIAALVEAVDENVEGMQLTGEQVPPSLCERNFSGKIVVRTSRELHARLALEGEEQRISMNQWIVQKLATRQLDGGFRAFPFD